MTEWRVPFCEPDVSGYVEDVARQLHSGWVGPGPRVEELERRLAELTRAERVICTSSGTAALWAVARWLRIVTPPYEHRPRVLVPGYGVMATPNAWKQAGWQTVFGDVDSETGCLVLPAGSIINDFDAVCYVNFSGRTATDLLEWRRRCDLANVVLVEDAACGLGHFYERQHAGTLGWFGTLSFSAPKLVTGGQGGAVICNGEQPFDQAAISDLISNRSDNGLNLRMTDLQAALILTQLDDFSAIWHRKNTVHCKLLGASDHVFTVPSGPPLHNIYLADSSEDRDHVHDRLREEYDIEARKQYEAFAKHPGCVLWEERALYLPFGNALTDDQVNYMAQALMEYA